MVSPRGRRGSRAKEQHQHAPPEDDESRTVLSKHRWSWSHLVADEAHALKNSTSIRHQRMMKVAQECDHRILLTGEAKLKDLCLFSVSSRVSHAAGHSMCRPRHMCFSCSRQQATPSDGHTSCRLYRAQAMPHVFLMQKAAGHTCWPNFMQATPHVFLFLRPHHLCFSCSRQQATPHVAGLSCVIVEAYSHKTHNCYKSPCA